MMSVQGKWNGTCYPEGGGNIAECIAFGRVCGTNVAAEKTWK